jgi:SAM-dependent methyltransferase
MVHIFSSNYLTRKPIEKVMRDFARRFDKNKKILDIGCGNKPYAKYFSCQYIGLDPFPETAADIVKNAWQTGCADNSFDGVILNQSLEHIPKTNETIAEILRILKPDGLVLVTVPQTMRHHSVPLTSAQAPYKNFDTQAIPYWNEDYFRFTKFGLIYLFRDFQILSLSPNQSYLVTLIQLWNYFLASLNLGALLAPVYYINNLSALLINIFTNFLAQHNIRYKALVHEGLTIDHTLIAQKK